MAEVIDVDSYTGTNTQSQPKKTLKRKRKSSVSSLLLHKLTNEQKEAHIEVLKKELEGLFGYYREVMDQKVGFGFGADLGGSEGNSLNGRVGLLMEESQLALSKLVAEIHFRLSEERGKGNEDVTLAMVKTAVLFVGQRVLYGVPNVHADVLEDETQACLWCWETRDLKLMPKCLRGALKARRMCRKKIHERVSAVSEVITALKKLEDDQSYKDDLMKASEKLCKALDEVEIRSFVDIMIQKNGAEMADKEAKKEQKLLIKQLEKNKRQAVKEKKMMDLEHEKEKKQTEKEQKRLQEEAEKDEKRREKEETEMRKQLRKQQEEVEKEQRRKEKEEAELKKRIAIQKQASIMERFLKRSKSTSPCQNGETSTKASPSISVSNPSHELPDAVTIAMDSILSSNDDISVDDIRKSHLSSWNHLGLTIRTNGKQHWSIRKKPKTELFKELKLSANREGPQDDELNVEKLVGGWGEQSSDRSCVANSESSDVKKCKRRKQLLQFDKSHRPAFFGIWPKKSNVIGPRHPLRKEPELEYDVDSDEEWEEEDPGENLSDCDKDEEEEGLEEGCSKDEDESEDEFFVPDGYLSENEGVEVDRMEIDPSVEEAKGSSNCNQDLESDEFRKLLQQQKFLNNLTESALRKNQPLIISNLMHEKLPLLEAEDLTGTSKLEKTCLEALSMRTFPGAPHVEISNINIQAEDQDACFSSSKVNSSQSSTATAIQELDMPTIVSTIQSCSQSINKVLESLQQKFPTVPKTQLRSRVREISSFVDNHWKVKKEILEEVGIRISPVKGGVRMPNISTFFSKRCLPPAAKSINPENCS
ncbi:chromatin assembly factor 1 subunit FAS1 [Euphorbia lathyris]|uniref:chromatin assembly factor 1 subunit FAS1 n=1 Tax=Euphorbia lathyris TaxID=212925 RepID=UPI0033141FD6